MATKGKGQRLLNSEIDKRVIIKLDKTISEPKSGYDGLMMFGEKNDYPQVIEKLINNSVTAKTAAGVYARFLTGAGFVNEAINKIVVGKDARGKDVTAFGLLRQVAMSSAMHNGFYIHCNINPSAKVTDVHLKPFKDCRFSKPDDTGFSAKILFYDNWANDHDFAKFDKSKVSNYHAFNLDPAVFEAQVTKASGKFNGQVYYQFFDDQYFYPLSPFDPVFLDCDTEYQIALFKNRQIRDGMMDKIIMRVAPSGDTENDRGSFAAEIKTKLGADGDTVIIMEDEFDDNGEISSSSAFKIDRIATSVNDKLFENWEKSLSNNIRKTANNLPKMLIDIEESVFSGQSGESIKQATNFFNAMTQDARALISQSFADIFKHSSDEVLKLNTNWEIKPLELIQEVVEVSLDIADKKKIEAQATLKGSVGGVTALISLQQSVSAGTTDLNAAIEIVKEIYGFSDEVAKSIIGTPKIDPNATTPTV